MTGGGEGSAGGAAGSGGVGVRPVRPEDVPTAVMPDAKTTGGLGGGGAGGISWAAGVRGMPTRIGRYEIVRVIASGGMGTVFEAMQDQPRRVVALKLLRAGIASGSALRRFEYEAQLLGRLRHPGVAQVYEAGTHEQATGLPGETVSLPYIAMEFVPGARTLTEFAEAKRLSVRERLDLFARVCDAVHHGHQRGVIHRDLKPGNILIDADGQPKVIDFGVARAVGERSSLVTQEGQVVGTIQYMSPEQIDLESDALDVRSDVYALGVALYELLTGRPPYDLTDTPVHRATQIIREQAPSRLSQYVGSLKGDVETIVLKALEKERERRYQSAADLEADLRRFLNNEPISARAPSVAYQVKALARRHRVAFAAAGVVAATLVVAASVSTVFAVRAVTARDEARRASRLALVQKGEADAARETAEREAASAQAVNRALRDALSMASPSRARGRAVTVREAVEAMSQRVPELTAGNRGAEAAVRSAVGGTLQSLGQYAAAEAQLRGAVELLRVERGADAPETLAATTDLASAVMEQGRFDEAIALDRTVLSAALRARGSMSAEAARAMNTLAWHVFSAGRGEEAEPMFREAMSAFDASLGAEATASIKSRTNLAACLADLGKTGEAAPLAEYGRDGLVRTLGAKHPETVYARHIFAYVLMQEREFAAAAELYAPIVADAAEVYGEEHPHAVYFLNNLAWCLVEEKRGAEAEALFVRIIEMRRRLLPDGHPYIFDSRRGLAMAALAQGRAEDAERMVRETYEECAAKLGAKAPVSREVAGSGATIAEAMGRAGEAAEWRERAGK